MLNNLKYNTMRQQLADFAEIQTHVARVLNLTDRAWVPFGVSFSGMLSVFYRQKYPHLVNVSVSSSAPVQFNYDSECFFTIGSRT